MALINPESELYTAKELAEYLDLDLGTLYQMNRAGSAPRRIKVGRQIRYRKRDVEAWLDKNVVDDKAYS